MRQLHPVAFHEQFLASGTYIHERDGKPDGVVESWTIHGLPHQSHLIRVDRDERAAASGSSLLLEALRDSAGNIQRFDVHLYNPKGTFVQQAKASYIVFERHIQIARQINNQPQQSVEISLPPKCIIYPHMYVFAGTTIQQVLAQGGDAVPVFIPNRIDLDTDSILSGIIETYSVFILEKETIGGEMNSTQGYRFFSRHDDEQAVFWLDQQSVLMKIQSPYEGVLLKNDARSRDFKQ